MNVFLVTRGCLHEGIDQLSLCASYDRALTEVDSYLKHYEAQHVESLCHWFIEYSQEFPDQAPKPEVFIKNGPNSWESNSCFISIEEKELLE